MKINTSDITPQSQLSTSHNLQIYNGLDCCITLEIFQHLEKEISRVEETYFYAREFQAPLLEMMMRGFLVDLREREKVLLLLEKDIKQLEHIFSRLSEAVASRPINWRSSDQLKKLFYTTMKLPPQHATTKGVKRVSVNADALDKLETFPYATILVATIKSLRDLSKEYEAVNTKLGPGGRFYTSYNIGGTETGRLSSSKSAEGFGRNMQNLSNETRGIFIADKGWKLCGIDLQQAESREVGWILWTTFNDRRYLDACYAGDLHTLICRDIWPELPWTNHDKGDREVADTEFFRGMSYRDFTKRGGHGSNYGGSAWTISRVLKVPVKIIKDFQLAYLEKFGLNRWHQWVQQQLQTKRKLQTPWGRTREFYNRANDPATLREAIAYVPQSCTADRMNRGMLAIWQHFGPRIQLLAQVHDAIYFQFREDDDEREIVNTALKLVDIRLPSHRGLELIVPGDAKTGWQWRQVKEKELTKFPNGLTTPFLPRKRYEFLGDTTTWTG